MGIPFGFYQGNRSEYLAIPALSKLGFTIPIPRQEDHFGVDFIVHLARNIDKVVTPTGKAFGIQIKSNNAPLIFDTQDKRDCLYSSSLPFFLGVVNRQNLTLTVYNTLNRLNLYWMLGSTRDFSLIVNSEGDGIPKPDPESRTGATGKPILEISISEPSTPRERAEQIEVLQSTMQSWINLESENLSLKEQGIALLFWPSAYSSNKPLAESIERVVPEMCSYTKFAGPDSLPHICTATEKVLTSLSFYLRKLPRNRVPEGLVDRMEQLHPKVDSLQADCRRLRNDWRVETGPPATPSESRQ